MGRRECTRQHCCVGVRGACGGGSTLWWRKWRDAAADGGRRPGITEVFESATFVPLQYHVVLLSEGYDSPAHVPYCWSRRLFWWDPWGYSGSARVAVEGGCAVVPVGGRVQELPPARLRVEAAAGRGRAHRHSNAQRKRRPRHAAGAGRGAVHRQGCAQVFVWLRPRARAASCSDARGTGNVGIFCRRHRHDDSRRWKVPRARGRGGIRRHSLQP